jgi:hypothetical protein
MDNKVMFAVMGLGAVGLFFYAKEASAAKSTPALPASAPPNQLPAPGAAIPGNIPSSGIPNISSLPGASSSSPEFQAAQAAAAALMARFPGGAPAASDN